MQALTPQKIVTELDRFIIGQDKAKRAVAIALRNRWRRQQLEENLKEEVQPKNILMIGPTGVGKTEIARRLAKLVKAPFIKVEATKFTEVGYVGRDVEQIIRDLVEISLSLTKEHSRKDVLVRAQRRVINRIINSLQKQSSALAAFSRQDLEIKLAKGEFDKHEIDVEITDSSNPLSTFDIPGMPGAQMGMMNIGDIFSKTLGKRTKRKRLNVKEAYKLLMNEESEKLLDQDKIVAQAIDNVEQNGIVFIDEFDKICARYERHGADVSREGVQRDLLPLIEGTTVQTKHGTIKTTHILFIASGAFHMARPSDLLPELQGRLPIRVELGALSSEDFVRILTETEASLIKQYKAMMATEEVVLEFTENGINRVATLSYEINQNIENIGARRLHTVLEKLLENISFESKENSGKTITIDQDFVQSTVGKLSKSSDLSKFIL